MVYLLVFLAFMRGVTSSGKTTCIDGTDEGTGVLVAKNAVRTSALPLNDDIDTLALLSDIC